jgi:hypothetical protein
MVASAAATPDSRRTLARARGRHQPGAPRRRAERQARRNPHCNRHHVRLDARKFDGEHLPGASPPTALRRRPANAVFLRERAQPLEELIGHGDVAALALNWLDDNRRDFVRRHGCAKIWWSMKSGTAAQSSS